MPSSKPLAEYARKRDFRQTPEPVAASLARTAPGCSAIASRSTTPAACTTTSAWSWMAP